MKIEDYGAAISLVVCDQPLTLDDLNRLISYDSVDQVLVDDDEVTILFNDGRDPARICSVTS